MARTPKVVTKEEAEQFAAAYLEARGNATQAMRRLQPELTPGSAKTRGCMILKHPEVQAAVKRIREQFTQVTILQLDQALEILSNIARGIPSGGFPPSAAERIAAVKQMGVYMGWEPQEEKKPAINSMGSLIARIRMAKGTVIDADALSLPSPPDEDIMEA